MDAVDEQVLADIYATMRKLSPGELAEQYTNFRDGRDACRKREAAFNLRMSMVEAIIHEQMANLKVDAFKASTRPLSVYEYIATSTSCNDPVAFRQFCIDTNQFDLMETRAAKAPCEIYAEEHEGNFPIGVTYNKILKLGVRKVQPKRRK